MPEQFKLHLTYIWLDANYDARHKVKIMDNEHQGTFIVNPKDMKRNHISQIISKLPIWNYDGSSTGQAERNNSEVILIPQVGYTSPDNNPSSDGFIRLWILCECYLPSDQNSYVPHPTNHRYNAKITYSEPIYKSKNNLYDSSVFSSIWYRTRVLYYRSSRYTN